MNPQRSDTPEDGATSWTFRLIWATPTLGTEADTLLSLLPGTHLLTVLATNDEGCFGTSIDHSPRPRRSQRRFSLPEGRL